MSRYVFPSFTSHYYRYGAFSYSKLFGYFRLFNPVLPHSSYFKNIFLTQLSLVVLLPFMRIKSHIPRLPFVLLRANPLQIIYSIVSYVPVLMIYFKKGLGVRYKSCCNESVYKKLFRFFVFVKHNRLVSVTNKPRLKITTILDSILRRGPHSSILSNIVMTVITMNFFHRENNTISFYLLK